jgi:hypothetical protein
VCGREALGGAPGSDGTVGPASDGFGEPWRRRSGLRPPELAAADWRRQSMAGDDGRRCRRVQRPSGREERDRGARGRKRAPAARKWSVAALCSISELGIKMAARLGLTSTGGGARDGVEGEAYRARTASWGTACA